MKNMKKVLFLLLFLVLLGAANVSAQVRIGGDEAPNEAAVLDLNADDATDTGTKGLALPRVSLDSNDDDLGYSDLLEGMLVYNTNAGMTGGDGVGVYYWDGSQWVKPAGGSDYTGSTSIVLSGNSFQRAALIGDVTAAANSNETTIANNAVTSTKIANGAVTLNKLSYENGRLYIESIGSTNGSGGHVSLPSGCNYNNTSISWENPQSNICGFSNSTTVTCYRYKDSASSVSIWFLCFKA